MTLALREEKYEVSVADDGIGMNEEQLAHIFDRFYRVDSTDTAVQGVGLGMSIVRNIILAHHGNIQIDSQMGSGTIVYIALPMMPPEGAAESHNPFSADLS